MLFDRMKVPDGVRKPSGTLLVLNGAGGVGSMLIQLANRLTSLTVIATTSRPESVEWARKLGAKHVADHSKPIDEALHAIGFSGVDYIAAITTTSGSAPSLVRAMNPQGQITLIDNFDDSIAPFKPKSITVSWEMMFTRSLFQTADMDAQHRLLKEVSAMVDAGALRTTLTHVGGPLTAANLRLAHERVETGRAIGKTVLLPAMSAAIGWRGQRRVRALPATGWSTRSRGRLWIETLAVKPQARRFWLAPS
jgi:zinc-binding alcohol dehydrogenase family protein